MRKIVVITFESGVQQWAPYKLETLQYFITCFWEIADITIIDCVPIFLPDDEEESKEVK
tara:strand:- start:1162 stop:1338 length:177 start_codon:yes stop_codon:yes gene_type:complete